MSRAAIPMMRKLGFAMGALFLFGGLLGFVPGVIVNGLYFGLFRVNTAHGILHIFSGAVFLVAARAGVAATRWWFRIFGILYGALAVAGLKVGEGVICGISNNRIDAWGHAVLALGMLAVGFVLRTSADLPLSCSAPHWCSAPTRSS